MSTYEPSALESEWHAAVRRVNPVSCGAWKKLEPLDSLLRSSAERLAAPSPSYLSLAVGLEQKKTIRSPIEPLVGSLRHPLLCAPGNGTRARMMEKSHLRIPSREELEQRRRRHSRMILIDCGAGIYSTGGVRGEPGSGDGGSIRWITEAFAAVGAPFDRVLAWEARSLRPSAVWRDVPAELVPRLSYYNVPISADPDGRHNPWRVLRAIATPADYVVVKLDVDNSPLELALVHQLLAPGSPVAPLVDEVFWEHHVTGSLAACPRHWGCAPARRPRPARGPRARPACSPRTPGAAHT